MQSSGLAEAYKSGAGTVGGVSDRLASCLNNEELDHDQRSRMTAAIEADEQLWR